MMTSQDRIWLLELMLGELDDEAEGHLARLSEIDVERQGLQISLRRAQGQDGPVPGLVLQSKSNWSGAAVDPAPPAAPEQPGSRSTTPDVWSGLNQAQLVSKILESAERPMSNKDVAARLAQLGRRQESTDAVRGTLGYLKRTGKADFAGRGQWYLVGSRVHQALQDQAQEQPDRNVDDVDDLLAEVDRTLEQHGDDFEVTPKNAKTPAAAGASGVASEDAV